MKITTKKLTTLTSLFLLISNSAIAAQNVSQTSLQQQLNELQKQINLLERKQEVVEEISKSNADKYATVSFDNKGLVIDSPDHKYSFKLKGYIQADSRNYVDRQNREVDQFLIRSARPVFEAKFPQGFSTRLMLDFGNNQARLVDAFGDWKLNDKFTLRLGKFKTAVGLERWQGETEILFVERGLTTNLVPFRDIGIAASGEIIPQTLEYQLSLTNGVSDNADGNGDTGNGKDLTARLFTQPFKNTDLINLQNFGIGLAGSFGQKNGNATNSELTTGYRTTAQNTFFTYTGGTFAKNGSTRINPQFWYYNGSFGTFGEYIAETNKVSRANFQADLTNKAWSVIATYVLTGENATFDGVKPKSDFNTESGNWGAFELAVRLGRLDIDRKTFPNFASAATSARSISETVIGLNWYLNQNIKINFDFSNNKFKGGKAAGQDREDENSFLTRLQVKF